MKGRTREKGFTLVEMLVVLVIIAVLVSIILPNALRSIDNANIKQAAADLRNIDAALNLCYTTNNQNWANCTPIANLWQRDANGNGAFMEAPGPQGNGNDPWGGAYAIAQDAATQNWYSVKNVIFPNWPDLNNPNRV
jgi:general secretion pathway protein G